MATTLKMTFMTTDSKTKVISVPSPVGNLQASQVDELMSFIVDNGMFTTEGADINGKVKASIETSSSSPLAITLS